MKNETRRNTDIPEPQNAKLAEPSVKTVAAFKPVPAVINAIRLLRSISEADAPLNLTEAARNADVPIPTALKILRTLTGEGIVSQTHDKKTYQLGVGLMHLAKGVSGLDQAALIRREMEEIANRHNCLTSIWDVTPTRVILRDRALSNRPVRLDMQVTQRMPVYLGAIGRAVAAARKLSRADLEREFSALRWARPIAFEDYYADIQSAHDCGYAIDRECLYDGIYAIGSVVTNSRGEARMGVSAIFLAGTHSEQDIKNIGERLVAFCRNAAEWAASST